MKGLRFIVMSLFLPFCATISFAQKEANNWYFGYRAGLNFSSPEATFLLGGQTVQTFAYATISDKDGNLLFYTDGTKIYNKVHVPIQNGPGIDIDPSLPSSIIIIPRPDTSNLYYLFYTKNNGSGGYSLLYSEIDMTLDGGLGGVTSSKNIVLTTLVTPQLTAIKNEFNGSYWLITHQDKSNVFLAFNISSGGINNSPITSAIGSAVNSSQYGNMKISPNGKRLAMAIYTDLLLCDFNVATGVVSNLKSLGVHAYGVEFSPNSKILYTANWNYTQNAGLNQYNLESNEISGVNFPIVNGYCDPPLQLAPDGKIYGGCENYSISVIHDPNVLGSGCNFREDGIWLDGKVSGYGLPQFVQSLFKVDTFSYENFCFGDDTKFSIEGNIDSVFWNFGDPSSGVNNTSTILEPTHVFSAPGTYTVTLTATKGSDTSTDSATVIIYEQPTATQPSPMWVCDEDGDGYVYFDLTLQDAAILNGQDPAVFEVLYYTAPFDYSPPIADPTNVINIDEYAGQLLYARVKNRLNGQCEANTTFTIGPISEPNQSVSRLALCDNSSVGSDFDGLVQIDLTQKEFEILNGQDAQNFTVSYFTDALLQNEILDPTQYQNTNLTETIYVLVSNYFSSYCSGETQFEVEVYLLPVVSPAVELKQCDDDLDGFSLFNLNEVVNEITQNAMNEVITFHESQADANAGIDAIENAITYINQAVSSGVIYARVENSNGCFTTSKVNLVVTTTQIPSTFVRDFYTCDVSENGISIFDFSSAQTEIEALFPIGQDLVIRFYRNQADALAEIGPIEDISEFTNTGSPYLDHIYVRVDSKIDNDCIGLGSHINLYVEPLPDFEVETPQIVCSSDPSFTVLLDPEESNPAESFSYSWMLNGVEIATSPTLEVSIPGTYSITLTKTDGTDCLRTKEVFVNASELATITSEDLTIVQLSDNNSITINTSHLGLGDYEFALDYETSIFQDEPYFDQVRAGKHTIFVRDKNGCGTAQLDVFIMGFPKFFTPNDDGFNDTWNIQGLGNEYTQNSTVYIFDRYGKLIKELNPRGEGWNGTFNGEKLRPSDYWFVIELVNVEGVTTTYRGHFSLVR